MVQCFGKNSLTPCRYVNSRRSHALERLLNLPGQHTVSSFRNYVSPQWGTRNAFPEKTFEPLDEFSRRSKSIRAQFRGLRRLIYIYIHSSSLSPFLSVLLFCFLRCYDVFSPRTVSDPPRRRPAHLEVQLLLNDSPASFKENKRHHVSSFCDLVLDVRGNLRALGLQRGPSSSRDACCDDADVDFA